MAKINLQDYVKYGKLFDAYEKLLSEDRQKVMSMYFEFNMTLAEIAKEKDISRQAVLDSIEKSCLKLEEYESKLHIVQKEELLETKLKELLAVCKTKEQKQNCKLCKSRGDCVVLLWVCFVSLLGLFCSFLLSSRDN